MSPNDPGVRVNEEQQERPKSRNRLRDIVRRNQGASRFGFVIDTTALKDAAAVLIPIVILVIAAFWVASRFVRPAPPDSFVMSTGAEGGAYDQFAQRYRDILARDGVTVELRRSAGSMENLKRLADPASGVEAAFVQAGVTLPEGNPGLVSLGSIYYEPLWIFYRGRNDIDTLNLLRGRRIAIGAEGSGTRALALQLMRAVGATPSDTNFEPLGGNDAADALIAARIDAAFLVAAPDAPVIQRLIKADGIRLMNVANAEAYTRRYPFLTALTLPRGVVDLAAQLPARDVTLLAATASIVIRDDFHPALAFLLLSAAAEIHSGAGILQKKGEFPAARETEFVLSAEAERYFKSGPPFLQRYLPFWLANLIERMLVLLVPLFAVLVPAFKILPGLFQWRVKSRVFRWYGEIKFLEAELAREPERARDPAILERLDEIERGVARTPVPMSYADYAYNLRTHIDVVRHRIERLSRNEPKPADPRIEPSPVDAAAPRRE